jgi:hypothetical protein
MTRPSKVLALVLGVLLACAASADARTRKGKQAAVAKPTANKAQARGQNRSPAGPVYAYGEYMGDDPDPFIRLMLSRDAAAHFDGAH